MTKIVLEKLLEIPLLKGLSVGEVQILLKFFHEVSYLPNANIIKKNEASRQLYILLSGSIQLKIFEENIVKEYLISTKNAIFGELSFVSETPRSADVNAVTQINMLQLSAESFDTIKEQYPKIALQLITNLSSLISDRVRTINNDLISEIRSKLKDSLAKLKLGRMLTVIIVLINLYVLLVMLSEEIIKSSPSTSFISIPLLFVMMAIILFIVKKKKIPIILLGVTSHNLQNSIWYSFILTIPVLIALTILKWIFVKNISIYNNIPIFNFPSMYNISQNGEFSLKLFLFILFFYTLGCIIQELLTRGFIQGLLQEFLSVEHRTLNANLIATSLFSIMHLQYSVIMAAIVIPFSLFWGYLFSKFKNIVGCCLSHIMVGFWALFVLDFERLLF